MNFRWVMVVLAFFMVILVGCNGISTNNDSGREEVWARMPFYGEIRFWVVQEGAGTAVPDAVLQVSGLPVVELIDADSVAGDGDGRIVIHQIQRGTTYTGDDPTPPSFTFDAPNYQSHTLSLTDLTAGTVYDPYKSDDMPTTIFKYGNDREKELPVYEFTIHLIPDES